MRALLLALAIGCGSEPSTDDMPPPMDGGVEDGGMEERCTLPQVQEPTPPADPQPVVWSCPTGWRVVDGCSPWPENGPLDCPPGEAHFPGSAGCESIGTDCPLGQFADPPPEYSTWVHLYVDRNARAGGDGMTAQTATTALIYALRTAIDTSAPTIVLVAKGEYTTNVLPVRSDMAIFGACVRDTIVRSSTTATDPNSYFGGSIGTNASIENLTISIDAYGIVATPDSELRLRGVVLEGATTIGFAAFSGSMLDAQRVVVRGVATGLGMDAAAFLSQAGNAVLDQVIAEDADIGLLVQPNQSGDPGTMRATAVHLRDDQGHSLLEAVGRRLVDDDGTAADGTGDELARRGGAD